MMIPMDHPIPVRRSDLVLTRKKKTCHLDDFTILVNHKESAKQDKYLELARAKKSCGTWV